MNIISKDDVTHIAKLAHIHLAPKEIAKFTGELSHILEYVQQLQNVDTRGVHPTAHASGSTNAVREDVMHAQTLETKQALLAGVPEKEGEFVKVKSVFGQTSP